ncbi:hypothetical protein [Synechococcus sp. CCY 9618]|uniref:hypothetical protein n=1 Tax=Synechococcus sp. CCY 9618 TaxID=2815602 RepID=UPI001C223206|nr:hypothetical protein [Synechococcus sp. CCY 9618]
MIECIRLWTDAHQLSAFERGFVELAPGKPGDLISAALATGEVSFSETASGGSYGWHTAPTRRFVITLSGSLEFRLRNESTFLLTPGIVLLAEDTSGSGHAWRMVGPEPWRRLYVTLAETVVVPFRTAPLPPP